MIFPSFYFGLVLNIGSDDKVNKSLDYYHTTIKVRHDKSTMLSYWNRNLIQMVHFW